MINRQSFIPIYIQIAQTVMQNIQQGGIAPGEPLPSERELAERHHVSRVTARQAIDELVKRGMAYRLHGKGTFLTQPKIRQASGLISFSEELRQRQLRPGSRVLQQRLMQASADVAARLQVEAGASVLRLDRIRYANQQPVAVEYAHINLTLLPGLDTEDFEAQSLFDVIRQRYGVYPTWAEAEIEARIVQPQEAEWLHMGATEAVLVAHRRTFTEAFEPIESVDSVYPGDRFPLYMGRQRVLANLEET